MAINVRKRSNGKSSYRVRVKTSSGDWITKTFRVRKEAEAFESELKLKKFRNFPLSSTFYKQSVNDFWKEWSEKSRVNCKAGWKLSQEQMYRDYIAPFIGELTLRSVNGVHVLEVINHAKSLGRSRQTLLHVYNLMNKMFSDALEDYEYIHRNPVKKSFRPQLIKKEAVSLTIDEIKELLLYVKGKKYGLAIWVQLFCGLRVGELQVLKWKSVDLKNRLIHIRSTYAKKIKEIQDYPKGKKWHYVSIPEELYLALVKEYENITEDESYVFSGEKKEFLPYPSYYKTLKKYCKDLKFNKNVTTHSLRHSTATLYIYFGASKDDLQHLFAHSSLEVTSRYIHDTDFRIKNLQEISSTIKLSR
ncbi:MAG: tyrosine-type recombinase/integrase [Bacteriovoracaceae bacterium]